MSAYRKKLIEVALPLDAINKESAREKEPFTRNHPRSLHIWWARRPLVACRAVLFASLVDDPSALPEQFPTEEAQEAERQRLFRIVEALVKWENSNDEVVLDAARREIARSVARAHGVELPADATPGQVAAALQQYAPPVLDPFCGGGSIPLEAQRLGLEAHASDLNPVAVLITKALIEIPPKFAGQPPVNPEARRRLVGGDWRGAKGLAEDVRYYGKWMRDEAERRIGHLYPKVKLPPEQGGGETTVIAWLWARTVRCPNPACGARMPMLRSFWLSTRETNRIYVHPVIDHAAKTVCFEVRQQGTPEKETSNRLGARCIFCGTTIKKPQLRELATQYGLEVVPLAIVGEGRAGRIYLSFPATHVPKVNPPSLPELDAPITNDRRWFSPPLYGMPTFADLFTSRQLVALATFTDLVCEAREQVARDAVASGWADDGVLLSTGGNGAMAYADAVTSYLALALSRWTDLSNTIASWNTTNQNIRSLFARQAIPMAWDFAEVSPFGTVAPIDSTVGSVVNVLENVSALGSGDVEQQDAMSLPPPVQNSVISTDPPYYDNIGYADLSDFFYVWLRRSLSKLYPELFSTLLVPKAEELVAAFHRFGGNRGRAETFFEEGLGKAFANMRAAQHPDYPLTVYYAFKQTEADDDEAGEVKGGGVVASTGWETMLEGLLKARFAITGTWPMRTERGTRSVGIGTNALASSIVLVCRPRPDNAPLATRREFLTQLRRELPTALKTLQRENIAPVDLAQAAIGPGMAVFSRYSKVVEADGSPMRVRTALQLINQTLDEVLAEQESEYDADTRWALAWFDQNGMNEGAYGVAETLSKAKNTAVSALAEAGILQARGGKVRLLTRDELSPDWSPTTDGRLTVWEVTQYLIRALQKGGEGAAADLQAQVGSMGEVARDLAYRLYTTCERKGWAQEALAYNSLVVAWPAIQAQAATRPGVESQGRLGIG